MSELILGGRDREVRVCAIHGVRVPILKESRPLNARDVLKRDDRDTRDDRDGAVQSDCEHVSRGIQL